MPFARHSLKKATFFAKPSSPSAGPYGHGTFAPAKPSFLATSAFADVQRKDLRVQPVQPGWYE